MVLDAPKWIDTCYVQNILRTTENDEFIKIFNIAVKPATAKGDNYMSDIYRVGAEFLRILDGLEIHEKRSLIIKLLPVDTPQEEMIIDFGIFETEISIVSSTLPRINDILAEIGMSSLSARCLFVQREKPVHLVFEDLATRRFQMADRQAGLDLDHCLLAIRNLARLHAGSIKLKEKDPNALAKYAKGPFHKDQPASMGEVFKAGVRSLAKEANKWYELNPRISEKLYKLSEVVREKVHEVSEYREDEFNVLNHGDFWTNNMLFSYDELGNPVDSVFVDFQLSHHGSPALDINYFWASTPSDDVRMNHHEEILCEYHNSLTSTMAKLKCNTEAPSLDCLRESLERRAFYEMFISIVLLPVLRLDSSEARGLDEILANIDEESDNPAYSTNSYRKIITKLLPLYDSMGLLDD